MAVSEPVRPGVEHLLEHVSILHIMGRLSPQYFPGAPSLTGGWVWFLSRVRIFISVNKICTIYTWIYIYIYTYIHMPLSFLGYSTKYVTYVHDLRHCRLCTAVRVLTYLAFAIAAVYTLERPYAWPPPSANRLYFLFRASGRPELRTECVGHRITLRLADGQPVRHIVELCWMPRISGASYIHLSETLARSLLRANQCWWAELTLRSAWFLIYALAAYQSGQKLHSIETGTSGVCLFVHVFVTNQQINQPSNVTTYTLISEIRGSNTQIIKNTE